ncbi:MAG: MauE/DoxX family redox-associated membrane protein [Acidimicrobiia bacterium]
MSQTSKRWDRVGVVMGVLVFLAGVQHFANPDFFNDIVPPWLPPSESFWTYLSGVAELVIGAMLISPHFRREGALAAIGLFVAVYPANIYMVWDWRDRELSERLVSYGRLPLQFVIVWLAWKVHVTRRSSAMR